MLAGIIAQCIGNPGAGPRWQWRCGFYPGSRPGECTNGTARDFEEARTDFETAWRVFVSVIPLPAFVTRRSRAAVLGSRTRAGYD